MCIIPYHISYEDRVRYHRSVLIMLCEKLAENHGTHLVHLKETWFSSVWKSHSSKILEETHATADD